MMQLVYKVIFGISVKLKRAEFLINFGALLIKDGIFRIAESTVGFLCVFA